MATSSRQLSSPHSHVGLPMHEEGLAINIAGRDPPHTTASVIGMLTGVPDPAPVDTSILPSVSAPSPAQTGLSDPGLCGAPDATASSAAQGYSPVQFQHRDPAPLCHLAPIQQMAPAIEQSNNVRISDSNINGINDGGGISNSNGCGAQLLHQRRRRAYSDEVRAELISAPDLTANTPRMPGHPAEADDASLAALEQPSAANGHDECTKAVRVLTDKVMDLASQMKAMEDRLTHVLSTLDVTKLLQNLSDLRSLERDVSRKAACVINVENGGSVVIRTGTVGAVEACDLARVQRDCPPAEPDHAHTIRKTDDAPNENRSHRHAVTGMSSSRKDRSPPVQTQDSPLGHRDYHGRNIVDVLMDGQADTIVIHRGASRRLLHDGSDQGPDVRTLRVGGMHGEVANQDGKSQVNHRSTFGPSRLQMSSSTRNYDAVSEGHSSEASPRCQAHKKRSYVRREQRTEIRRKQDATNNSRTLRTSRESSAATDDEDPGIGSDDDGAPRPDAVIGPSKMRREGGPPAGKSNTDSQNNKRLKAPQSAATHSLSTASSSDDDEDELDDDEITQKGKDGDSIRPVAGKRAYRDVATSTPNPSPGEGLGPVLKKKRQRDNWTPEEDAIFFRLYRENENTGMSDQALLRLIADRLGPRRTYQQVKGHLKNMRAAAKV